MYRRGTMLAFALAVCALACTCAAAAGDAPARNGEIAFVRCCPERIVIARPDGTHARDLTDGPGGERWPSFSPDGRTVVFARARVVHTPYGDDWTSPLYAIGVDGGHERRLTPATGSANSPAFSPDGRRIAFAAGGVWIMDADGGHQLPLSGGRLDGSPVFSPDGRRVFFVRPYTGDRGSVPGAYVVDVDGRHERRLDRFRSGDSAPSFSPDGRRMAFARVVDTPRRSIDCDETDVFVARADGTHPRRLTRTRCGARQPRFSPDGRSIVFSLRLDRSRHGGYIAPSIYVMRADGKHLRPLTSRSDIGWDPAWQPVPAPVIRDEPRGTLGP